MAKTIKYKKVNRLNDEEFKRVTGVTRDTFKLMVKTLSNHYRSIRAKGGRKSDHTPSDQILMMLEYYREYRTYKHIAVDFNTSESTACYTIKKVENILIKNPVFHLPSLRKVALMNANNMEVILIDVTETPCERPKKSKDTTTLEKRKDIQ